MPSALTIAFYVFVFLSTYVQVFLLVTFFDRRKELAIRTGGRTELSRIPGVTVIVPCYNEERTIARTVQSIMGLDYPKNKLSIILVDDGSTDGTWNIMERFAKRPGIRAFRKENGGKHTALNLGLEHTDTEFVGCLDADSFVDPQALRRIMTFFDDKEVMAVAPSIIVDRPTNLLQMAQKVEYNMSVYSKKMLAFMNGIHVTPGPFSIFRKKVFDTLGGYRKAHNTEDQEIALRMHEHGYRIEHCHDAYVYTVTPNTVKKLYKQRLRWVYGFIQNCLDYRHMLFRSKYGNVALFTLPSGMISVASVVFLTAFFLTKVANAASRKIEAVKGGAVGSLFGNGDFSWFFVTTKATIFMSIMLYALVIFSIVVGTRIAEGKWRVSWTIVPFIITYSIIAPFWLLKAIYNTIVSVKPSWR